MMHKRIEFSAKVRDQASQRAGDKCQRCGLPFGGKARHFDHILPAALGGKAELSNCQVLCVQCHTEKTSKEDVPRVRKADRQRRRDNGAKLPTKNPIKSAGFRKIEKPRAIEKRALSELGPSNIARRFSQ